MQSITANQNTSFPVLVFTVMLSGDNVRILHGNISVNTSTGNGGFEVFTALTMKNGIFWDVTLCDSCKSRRFGGT
jgi:hypothetical protein